MYDLEQFALAKLLEPKIKLKPGSYPVECSLAVDLKALIKKGPREPYTPTTSLPLKKVLAIALQKAGIQRDNIAATLTAAATEALQDNEKVGDYIEATEKALELVESTLSKLPEKTREGKTFVIGEFEIVQVKPLVNVA